ncbi:hypothetical protein CONCODRAFT_12017 [Conidiobolus coronatus NRRL 28638]|uniref:Helicase ATP-binding domain-containing protein n=1 Tax=Conidiobolus coronatus (strain ATCC 28846 / CBS 209.66 / NRRL 28638) TaxID=796925 RepID=A0A137NTX5_CONC2|nr:hypothetical protein CONCODRAFT_12017 [Conidiobolus coronatus NRRL 28638]|eukprot:KXN66189.1 hypothetical protein CONCODRAFT_12017 [Conidiobolus coronatus NRRL 28638]
MELNVVEIYGQAVDSSELESCHVLFSTPGRLVDLVRRRIVNVGNLKILIIDRVEDIYYRQSIEFLEVIFNFVHIKTQLVLVFEASVIEDNLKPFVNSITSPEIINVGEKESNLHIEPSISHYYLYYSGSDNKLEIIRDLNEEISKCCGWGIINAENQEFDELCKIFREMGSRFKLAELTYKLENSYDQLTNCLLINISANSKKTKHINKSELNRLKIIVNYTLPSSIQYATQCKLFNAEGRIKVINIVNSEDYKNFKDLEKDCGIKIQDLDQVLEDLIK